MKALSLAGAVLVLALAFSPCLLPSADALPAVVWLMEDMEAVLRKRPRVTRVTTLAMKGFRCLPVSVPDLPESEVKTPLRRGSCLG